MFCMRNYAISNFICLLLKYTQNSFHNKISCEKLEIPHEHFARHCNFNTIYGKINGNLSYHKKMFWWPLNIYKSKVMEYIIRYFLQIFCLEPFYRELKFKYFKLNLCRAVWCCHAILVTTFAFIMICNENFVDLGDSVSYFCFCVGNSTIILTNYVLLIESLICHKNYKFLPWNLNMVKRILKKNFQFSDDQLQKMHQKFIIQLTLVLLARFLEIYLNICINWSFCSGKKCIMVIIHLAVTLIQFKLFHAMFYIDLMNVVLQCLNEQLEKITEFINLNNEHLMNDKYSKFLCRRIKICKNIYVTIRNANIYINRFMGISQNAIVKLFHILIFTDSYW